MFSRLTVGRGRVPERLSIRHLNTVKCLYAWNRPVIWLDSFQWRQCALVQHHSESAFQIENWDIIGDVYIETLHNSLAEFIDNDRKHTVPGHWQACSLPRVNVLPFLHVYTTHNKHKYHYGPLHGIKLVVRGAWTQCDTEPTLAAPSFFGNWQFNIDHLTSSKSALPWFRLAPLIQMTFLLHIL